MRFGQPREYVITAMLDQDHTIEVAPTHHDAQLDQRHDALAAVTVGLFNGSGGNNCGVHIAPQPPSRTEGSAHPHHADAETHGDTSRSP